MMSSASDALGNLVIGSTVDPNDINNLRAVAWDLTAGGYIDLTQYLPSDIVSSSATAINRSGQIVGDYRKSDGTRGVFVLTAFRESHRARMAVAPATTVYPTFGLAPSERPIFEPPAPVTVRPGRPPSPSD